MLVDNGSLANIIFWSILKAMGISRTKLEKFNLTLVGFDGKETGSIKGIKLPVTARGVIQLTFFLVINSSSAYNAIIDRPWIHAMKVVSSTLNQKIKFPTSDGIGKIISD